MLSAYARMGDSFERGSLTLDATYPLAKLPFGTFAGYSPVTAKACSTTTCAAKPCAWASRCGGERGKSYRYSVVSNL